MLNQPAFEASVRAKQELLEQGFCKLSNILHPQALLQILLGASRLELAACDSLREYLNKADPKPRASTVLGTVSFNDDKQVQQIQSLLRLDLDGAGVFKTLANDLTPLLAFLLGVTEGELDVCATLYEHHRSDPECCFSQDNICTNLQNGQELVVAHILLDTHMRMYIGMYIPMWSGIILKTLIYVHVHRYVHGQVESKNLCIQFTHMLCTCPCTYRPAP